MSDERYYLKYEVKILENLSPLTYNFKWSHDNLISKSRILLKMRNFL
jgi:hypothetical protein